MTDLSPWIVIAILAAAGGFWLSRGRSEPEHGKWHWPLTGVAVGVMLWTLCLRNGYSTTASG